MTISQAVLSIQTLLTPVIMISACGLLLLGMLNRYGRINDRLRELARERMDLLSQRADEVARTRLHGIDEQLPQILNRNRILRDAVLFLFLAVICFVGDVFAIAFGLFTGIEWSVGLSVGTFLLGQCFVLVAMIFMANEIRISHRAVTFETRQLMKL